MSRVKSFHFLLLQSLSMLQQLHDLNHLETKEI
jgi:hypothetical protein